MRPKRRRLDGGISVLDSRTFVHYCRDTPDGRLMLGKGGNTFAYGGRMHRVFDQPSPYRDPLAERLRGFNAIRRKEAAEDRDARPRAIDRGLARLAAAAVKADRA